MATVVRNSGITLEEAAEIEFCELPGGYSPHATREDCWFDAESAERAVNFFPRFLVHIKGQLAGSPIELEPWQRNIIGTLFGWKRPDGTRRYRTAYVEIPRKAGKSTISSGIALLLLYLDDEPGAEIYSCAADRDQAAIVFDLAKENVLRNRSLSRRSTPYLRSIVHKDPNTGALLGSYKVLSADAHTKHGYNPHGIIFDELHAQPSAELWDVMNTGTGARSQPLTVAITTAGYDKTSVCYQQRTYAEKIRDGIAADVSFLPVIYSASLDDDWTSPETWAKAQPNLGVSVKQEFYESECKKAKENPAFENTFKRLYLNIWTEAETRAVDMQAWELASDPVDAVALEGRVCYGGLDLASKTDIAAFVLLFPNEDGSFEVLCWFWAPEEAATKRGREPHNTGKYQMWGSQGFLNLISGSRIDQSEIRKAILAASEKYRIAEIAYDPWNAEKLRVELEDDGVEMVEFHQGMRNFNEPTKEFLGLVAERKFHHGGNPVLRWMASNLSSREDSSGNIRPDKGSSGDKIDGIVAAIMALGRAMVSGDEKTTDVADMFHFLD